MQSIWVVSLLNPESIGIHASCLMQCKCSKQRSYQKSTSETERDRTRHISLTIFNLVGKQECMQDDDTLHWLLVSLLLKEKRECMEDMYTFFFRVVNMWTCTILSGSIL